MSRSCGNIVVTPHTQLAWMFCFAFESSVLTNIGNGYDLKRPTEFALQSICLCGLLPETTGTGWKGLQGRVIPTKGHGNQKYSRIKSLSECASWPPISLGRSWHVRKIPHEPSPERWDCELQ